MWNVKPSSILTLLSFAFAATAVDNHIAAVVPTSAGQIGVNTVDLPNPTV